MKVITLLFSVLHLKKKKNYFIHVNNKGELTLFTLVAALGGGIFDPPDLTELAGIPDFTTLGFSIGTTGKLGLSLSNFSRQNLTDIGYRKKTTFTLNKLLYTIKTSILKLYL